MAAAKKVVHNARIAGFITETLSSSFIRSPSPYSGSNSDGISQAGELKPLDELGITSIATAILQNFEAFMVKWTGLDAAWQAHDVTRTYLTLQDKVWMLEALTGLNAQSAAIEAAGFNLWSPSGGGAWNSAYIDSQWQAFVQHETISFTIQAKAQDWIKGAYYALNYDRFIVVDAALLQDSLVQGLSTIGNRQDAVFAVVTLDRLRSDGCDLQAANDASFDLLERKGA